MKKLVYMGITAVMVLTIAGCGKTLKVEATKQLTVEYGDKLDNSKLYDASKSDKDIKVAEVKGFDNMKVGNEKVKVTFTDKDGKSKTEKEIMIDIKDTKAPIITLDKDEVSVEQDKSIDLTKNVKSVKDPVDGDIKYSKTKVDKDGYYFDEGKLDTKKTGTYEVKVIAYDKNNNKAEKSFKVIVKEKEKETAKAPKEEASGTGNKTPNTTAPTQQQYQHPSGGNTSGNTQGNAPAKPESKPTPEPSKPTQPYIIDDGRKMGLPISMQSPIFDNPRAAEDWAEDIMNKSENDLNHPYYNCNGWSSTGIRYSDGSTKYSIYWY